MAHQTGITITVDNVKSIFEQLSEKMDQNARETYFIIDFCFYFPIAFPEIENEARRLNAHHGRSIDDKRTRGYKFYDKMYKQKLAEFREDQPHLFHADQNKNTL